MEFIDNTGHIFSIKSYNRKPIGYEYEEHPYIFWIDNKNISKLSINNYYGRSIYIAYQIDGEAYNADEDYLNERYTINISMDSLIYKLLPPNKINECINNLNSLHDDFEISSNSSIISSEYLKNNITTITNDDAILVKSYNETHTDDINSAYANTYFAIIPIYVLGYAKDAGTWLSNILINIKDNLLDEDNWCYITVGGIFEDNEEALVINGQNMGISLPKEILKAVYQCSYYNEVFDEVLFNKKMKEYLLNYMNIKGECGNFKSAIDSLKWFGYADKLNISKLLKTDNEFQAQYVHDYFLSSTDILKSYKDFLNTSYIAIKLILNKSTGVNLEQDLSSGLWGEWKPIMEDMLNKYEKVEVGYDEEKYYYWKPYYDFTLSELGLKLMCLKYYYEKYFLPLYIKIHSLSMTYTVHMNDVKYAISHSYNINSQPNICLFKKNNVIFPNKEHKHWFTQQIHIVNNAFIEEIGNEQNNNLVDLANNKIADDKMYYYINDTCASIPIILYGSSIYNCVLILENEDNEICYESHFTIINDNQDDPLDQEEKYKKKYKINYIIYPKYLNKDLETNKSKDLHKWVNTVFNMHLLVNDRWYTYAFSLHMPNIDIQLGTLSYKYWNSYIKNYINDQQESDIIISKSDNYAGDTSDVAYTIHSDSHASIDKYDIYSNFGQLNNLNENEIEFNSFMWEPLIATINDINYKNDIVHIADIFKQFDEYNYEYINLSQLSSVYEFHDYTEQIINDNTVKIYFNNNDNIHQVNISDIDISSDDLVFIDKLYNIYVLSKISPTIIDDTVMQSNTIIYKRKCDVQKISNDNILDTVLYGNYNTQYSNLLLNQYTYKTYITKNNKYLNVAHLYDIYKVETEKQYISTIGDEIAINIDGNVLEHSTTTFDDNGDIIGDSNKIYIHHIHHYTDEDDINSYTTYYSYHPWDKNSFTIDETSWTSAQYSDFDKQIQLCVIKYKTVDDFKNNNILEIESNDSKFDNEYILNNLYIDNDIYYLENDKEEDEPYKLTYKISYYNEGGYPVSYSELINNTYDYIQITFSYTEHYHIRNKKVELEEDDPETIEHRAYTLQGYKGVNNHIYNNVKARINMELDNDLHPEGEYIYTPIAYVNNQGNYKIIINSTSDNLNYKIYIKTPDNPAYELNEDNNEISLLSNSSMLVYLFVDNITEDISYIDFRIYKLNTINTLFKYEINEESDNNIPININDKTYYINTNTDQNTINLYNDFFEHDYSVYKQTASQIELVKHLYKSKVNINNKELDYDFYLMHDYEYWYGVFISKDTIDYIYNIDNKKVKKKQQQLYINGNEYDGQSTVYMLKYNRSDDVFLVNRMIFNGKQGYNHFKNNDIIAAYTHSNIRLDINTLLNNSKWKITPVIDGNNIYKTFTSNAEMTIIPIPSNKNFYDKGYYNINVSYSLDADKNLTQKLSTKFRID